MKTRGQSINGFPRAARLTTSSDYQRVFKGASKAADRYFTVLYRRNERPTARLGMAVSRRSAPRAVARNRIKRTIRESFRLRRDRLDPIDIVVIGRPPARSASRETLRESLERLWQRVVG